MLEFSVSNQLLSRLDATKVVADSENYLECAFQFSTDWDNSVAVATFGHSKVQEPISVRIVGGKCRVPHEVIKTYGFQVSVYGTVEEEFGEICHIPTNTVTVEVEASGVGSGLAPAEPTKSMYDALMSAIIEAEEEVLEAKISAKSSAEVAMGAQTGAEKAADSAKVSAATSAAEARNAWAACESTKVARMKMDALTELNKSYVLGGGEDKLVLSIQGLSWNDEGKRTISWLQLKPGQRYRVKVNDTWWDATPEWILEEEEVVQSGDGQAELFSLLSRPEDDPPVPEIPKGEEANPPGGEDDSDSDSGSGSGVTPPVTLVRYEVVKNIVKLVAGPLTIEDVEVDNDTGEGFSCRLSTTDRTVRTMEIWMEGSNNARYFYEQALAAAERAEKAAERAEARG